MCASNWPLACSAPGATAATCTLVADFVSLITLAGTLGTNGKTPLRTIMTPPPLWKDGACEPPTFSSLILLQWLTDSLGFQLMSRVLCSDGMNESVLNDVMPSLVPTIAKAAGLGPPIDIFTALGGTRLVVCSGVLEENHVELAPDSWISMTNSRQELPLTVEGQT